jgi:type II secretion system (T2SS) protein M
MTALKPRSMLSRALALGLLGLLAFLLWIGAVDPIKSRHDENDQTIADGISLLAGFKSAIAQETQLRSLITAHNAELTSARTLPPKSRDGLEYLGLGLQIRAEMKNIQAVLHAIETGTPLLFVERADLRLDERGTSAARTRDAESIAPMTLEIAVYGAKWPSLAPAPRGAKAQ